MKKLSAAVSADEGACERCHKRFALCVCSAIHPQDTKLRVIILQHPQEQDKDYGTARLAQLSLNHAELKIGLSWRKLKAVAGEGAESKHWGVLFLGSAKLRKDVLKQQQTLIAVNKKGEPLPDSIEQLAQLRGLIFLDGTWSQAKALWWRNPWLLKLHRLILNPRERSLYSKARREPRRECLSTIEAIGQSLRELDSEFQYEQLLQPFVALLTRVRTSSKQ